MHGLERIVSENAKYPEPTTSREDPRDKIIRALSQGLRVALASLQDVQKHGLGGVQRRNLASDLLSIAAALGTTQKWPPTVSQEQGRNARVQDPFGF